MAERHGVGLKASQSSMATIPQSLLDKIIAQADIGRRDWKDARPMVFTNGVFDLLHVGHVAYLAAARALGATLLVGVNTDGSARQLDKGPERPLNSERDRALVIAALQSVSYVTLFEEATPCELMRRCRPDVYVKGGDYDIEALEETRLVRSWGGRSLAMPLLSGYSTTALVQRIRGHDGIPLKR
jgi:rfaE bifunctional protein nucleotidyltransferase chain/domain